MSVQLESIQYDDIINKLSSITQKIDQISSLLGAPKPTYSITVTASTVATNKHHLVLFNNNPNIKVVVRRIILSAEVTGTVTGFEMSFRILRISGVTGGTAVAIQKFDTQDPDLSDVVAVAHPSGTTVVGTLDNIVVNPEETGGQHTVERQYGINGEKPIILYYGQGISIRQYESTSSGSLTATIVFTVE